MKHAPIYLTRNALMVAMEQCGLRLKASMDAQDAGFPFSREARQADIDRTKRLCAEYDVLRALEVR